MNWLKSRKLAVTVLLSAALVQAFAQADKRTVSIAIEQLATEVERVAWTAYGIALGDWVRENRIADSAPEGPFIPSFAAELHARKVQLQIWRDLNEKGTYSLPYMDTMFKVEAAGFLPEYVWHYHQRNEWEKPDPNLRMEAFSSWRAEHLRDHHPKTGAHISFRPPTKR